jgi:hypothetical protein
MASSPRASVDEYLASLPADRRDAIATIRKAILRNLPRGYEERLMAGMIAYVVPLSRLPKTYNGQPLMLAALASQKQHMSLYLLSVYGHEGLRAWFEQAWRAAGKKLDMGKSCVRFKRLEDIPLAVVGETIARVEVDRYVEQYHAARAGTAEGRRAAAKAATTSAKAATTSAKKASTSAKKAVTKPAAKSTAPTKPAAKSGARTARSGRTSAPSPRSRGR